MSGDGGNKTEIFTANTARDTLGVGGIINTKHEGTTKRRGEDRLVRKDEEVEAKKYIPPPAVVKDRIVKESEDGNEILTIENGVVIKREKRLPPGKRQD